MDQLRDAGDMVDGRGDSLVARSHGVGGNASSDAALGFRLYLVAGSGGFSERPPTVVGGIGPGAAGGVGWVPVAEAEATRRTFE